MRNIRAVFNDAINEDRVSLNLYPFRKFKIKKEMTQKRAITLEQLKEFRDFHVQKYQEKYRDLFMLTFYLIGINPTDLLNLRPCDYRDGRIRYTRAKTGRFYNIEVLPEAAPIIERYRGKDYLLNVLDESIRCKDFISRWDKNLKKIGWLEWVENRAKNKNRIKKNKKKIIPLLPELTIYSARHTWATLAIKLKISKDDVAAALGHGGNTVTDVYIDFDPEEIDKANLILVKALQ
jgi:integrase